MIGCNKEWEIMQYFQSILWYKKGLLCDANYAIFSNKV